MMADVATRAIVPDLDARLDAGVVALGLAVPPERRASLVAFLRSLAKWNAVFNLTSVRSIDDMLTVHLLDSLSVVPLLDSSGGTRLLDVGSGAGLPGIPIAITRPHVAVTTVDAVAKKISFQRQVKGELKIDNLTAMHARVEALTLANEPAIIISRAYTAIPDMIASIAHLTGPATRVIAMKGAEPGAELAALPDGWIVDEIRTLDVPGLGAKRCAVVLRLRS